VLSKIAPSQIKGVPTGSGGGGTGPQGPQGSPGVTGPQGAAGFISGVIYYLRAVESDIFDHEQLTRQPPSEGEVDEGVTVVGDGFGGLGTPVLMDHYATQPNDPGINIIAPGEWQFHFWAYTSVGGYADLIFNVYSYALDGYKTLLFTHITNTPITGISAGSPTTIEE
jgi:hypothetical protein